MEVKILVFKNDKYVISEIVEREEEPACLLINPKEIESDWHYNYLDGDGKEFGDSYEPENTNRVFHESETQYWNSTDEVGNTVRKGRKIDKYVQLTNFPPYTHQKQVLINSSDILTIVDPTPEILNLYRKVVG